MWQSLFLVLFFANGLAMNAVGLEHSDSSGPTNHDSTMISAPGFTLRFTANEAPAIGYAYIFACTVLEGEKTEFEGKSLSMTVLPGNKPVLETFRKAIATGETLIGKFEWQRDRCEYRHTTITGFVDAEFTAWKLVSLEIEGSAR